MKSTVKLPIVSSAHSRSKDHGPSPTTPDPRTEDHAPPLTHSGAALRGPWYEDRETKHPREQERPTLTTRRSALRGPPLARVIACVGKRCQVVLLDVALDFRLSGGVNPRDINTPCWGCTVSFVNAHSTSPLFWFASWAERRSETHRPACCPA